jgi:hypothetical protein
VIAGGPCTGLQSRLPAFLALTRVTGDEWQRLVPSLGGRVVSTDDMLRRPPSLPDAPHALAPDGCIGIHSIEHGWVCLSLKRAPGGAHPLRHAHAPHARGNAWLRPTPPPPTTLPPCRQGSRASCTPRGPVCGRS